MNIIEKAKQLAKSAHQGQKYGEHDYFDYHLTNVAANLEKNYKEYLGKYVNDWWLNNETTRDILIAAAWSHDLLEDTNANISGFPMLYKVLVRGMTKPEGIDYVSYITSMINVGVRAIKLADLSENIKESESRQLNGYEKQRLQKYKLARHILRNQNETQ